MEWKILTSRRRQKDDAHFISVQEHPQISIHSPQSEVAMLQAFA